MAEERGSEIKQERLFNPNSNNQGEREIIARSSEPRKEDYGVKRIIFSSSEEIFLKDQSNEGISSYKIPEGRKLEILFLGKINKEDEKTSCTINEIFREKEDGRYTNDLHEVQLKNDEDSRFVKRGVRVWLDSNDLIKKLETEEEKAEIKIEKVEKEIKDIDTDTFRKIGKNWKTYRPPYPEDEYNDSEDKKIS
jgi:hypothetical protein